jgi:hypothetical protein
MSPRVRVCLRGAASPHRETGRVRVGCARTLPCHDVLRLSRLDPRPLEIAREGTPWEGLPLPPGGRDPPPPEVNT